MSDGKKTMYTVLVERVEKYSLPVNVLATSLMDATRKVQEMDFRDRFTDYWEELQPSVETNYDPALSDNPERGEGPLA